MKRLLVFVLSFIICIQAFGMQQICVFADEETVSVPVEADTFVRFTNNELHGTEGTLMTLAKDNWVNRVIIS